MKQEDSASQKTILLVEDDPTILKVLCAILTSRNYRVLTADNGPEALQISSNHQEEIHLLLSDFHMPVMNGTELAARITGDRPRIKVLLISGFPGGIVALSEGWHFLAKPFLTSQLTAVVGCLIDPDQGNRFTV
jgi:two-component system, cell cycle sensor histidine kinase and response regulator CckA